MSSHWDWASGLWQKSDRKLVVWRFRSVDRPIRFLAEQSAAVHKWVVVSHGSAPERAGPPGETKLTSEPGHWAILGHTATHPQTQSPRSSSSSTAVRRAHDGKTHPPPRAARAARGELRRGLQLGAVRPGPGADRRRRRRPSTRPSCPDDADPLANRPRPQVPFIPDVVTLTPDPPIIGGDVDFAIQGKAGGPAAAHLRPGVHTSDPALSRSTAAGRSAAANQPHRTTHNMPCACTRAGTSP